MTFMYYSADFKYEDSVLRYMDLKCGIHKGINISNQFKKKSAQILN